MNYFKLSTHCWLIGLFLVDISQIDCQFINCNESEFQLSSTMSISIVDNALYQFTNSFKLIKYSIKVKSINKKIHFFLENGHDEQLEHQHKELKKHEIYSEMKKIKPGEHQVSFAMQKLFKKTAMFFHVITNPIHGGYTILYSLHQDDVFHEIKLVLLDGLHLRAIWPITMLEFNSSSTYYFIRYSESIYLFNHYLFKFGNAIGLVCLIATDPIIIKLIKKATSCLNSRKLLFSNIDFIFAYQDQVYMVNRDKLLSFSNSFFSGEDQVRVYEDDLDKRIHCIVDQLEYDYSLNVLFQKYYPFFLAAFGIIIIFIIISVVGVAIIVRKKNRKLYSQSSFTERHDQHRKRMKKRRKRYFSVVW